MADDAGSPLFRELQVLPFVAPPHDVLEAVMRGLSRRVRVPCRLRRELPPIEIPGIPGRDQADADRLLARLEELSTDSGRVLVGLTRVDIGHPIFTHFFGRARHDGRAVLVSAARLDPVFYGLVPDPAVTARRIVLEILHELGHVAGLGHCDDYGCVMRFASSVEAIDNRGTSFCGSCSAALPDEFAPVRAVR